MAQICSAGDNKSMGNSTHTNLTLFFLKSLKLSLQTICNYWEKNLRSLCTNRNWQVFTLFIVSARETLKHDKFKMFYLSLMHFLIHQNNTS